MARLDDGHLDPVLVVEPPLQRGRIRVVDAKAAHLDERVGERLEAEVRRSEQRMTALAHGGPVARFLECACPDHHVRGLPAHRMARHAAALVHPLRQAGRAVQTIHATSSA